MASSTKNGRKRNGVGTFQGEKFSRSQALRMTATHSKGISQKLSSDLANMLLSEMEANNKDESR